MQPDKPILTYVFFKGFQLALFVYMIVTVSPVKAQKVGAMRQPLQEFFMAEPVFVQDKKEIQLTLKPLYLREDAFGNINIPLKVEYGLTNRLQVELTLQYIFNSPVIGKWANGIGNSEIGILYNISNYNKPLALSIGVDVGLPTAMREKVIAETEIQWGPTLIVAKQLGKAQVHAGIAAEITKSESTFKYNMATVLPMGNWRATLELNGEIKDRERFYLTPGLVWKGVDDFEFGLAFSKKIGGTSCGYGFILMMTYEFF